MEICEACKLQRAEQDDRAWDRCRASSALACAIAARDEARKGGSIQRAHAVEYRVALEKIENLLGACSHTDTSVQLVRDAVARALEGVDRYYVRRDAPPSIAEPYEYTSLATSSA